MTDPQKQEKQQRMGAVQDEIVELAKAAPARAAALALTRLYQQCQAQLEQCPAAVQTAVKDVAVAMDAVSKAPLDKLTRTAAAPPAARAPQGGGGSSPGDYDLMPDDEARQKYPAVMRVPFIEHVSNESTCRSCEAPIVWCVTARGKRMPMDPAGTSHFKTCPNAKEHSQSGNTGGGGQRSTSSTPPPVQEGFGDDDTSW